MITFLLERNLLPDWLVRIGIRRLLAQRQRAEWAEAMGDWRAQQKRFAAALRTMPIAVNTQESKQQHYEVPTAFYQGVLGPRLKYSCGWFERGDESLAEAEEAMLRLCCRRAEIADGQDILELGCGWGSLSLWLAERFPRARITGVSHSRTQKHYIDAEAQRRGLRNVSIITCDMNDFTFPAECFDRVISIEMFEHMKNWPRLLAGVARALRPAGRLFLHIFTHRELAYHFEARDETDWMSRHFFTGGMMPSETLVNEFQEDLRIRQQWRVNGRHYRQTAEGWLANMDAHRETLRPIFEKTYGRAHQKWWVYWRVFFMSCAELWGYRKGEDWGISHYLLEKSPVPSTRGAAATAAC